MMLSRTLTCIASIALLTAAALPSMANELNWPSYEWTGPLKDFMKEVVDDYSAKNGVTVTTSSPNFAGFFDKQFIEVTSDNPPSIITLQDPQAGQYIAADLLEPLTSYYQQAGIDPATFPKVFEAGMKDGEIYAVPLQVNPRALIYNQAMFDAAGVKVPTNLDEFYEALKALRNEAAGQFGFALLGAPVAADPTAYEISNMVKGFGASFFTDGKPTANSPIMLEAMTFYKKIYDEGLIPRGIDFMTLRELLYDGKVAMLASAPFALMRAKAVNPTVGANLKTMLLPFPGNGESFTIMTLLGVPRDAANKEHAIGLLMSLLTEDNQRKLVEKYLSLPIRPVFTTAEIEARYPDFKAFIDASALSTSSAPQGAEKLAPQINAVIKRHFESFVYGNTSIKDGLDNMQAEFERLIATGR